MIASQTRFDPISRELLRGFSIKLGFILLIGAAFCMVAPQQLGLVCRLLQVQCMMCGAMAIGVAFSLRQGLNAPTLTYWDEALAFSGIATLGHLGAGLLPV